jgi:hypothetical protein
MPVSIPYWGCSSISILAIPFDLEGQEIGVTASMGICLYPRDDQSPAVLMRNADAAMCRAKEEGRNNYQFYTEELTRKAFQRILLETSLRQAVEREELLLYFQPQVNAKNQQVIGVEALIRWQHPELGLVTPRQVHSFGRRVWFDPTQWLDRSAKAFSHKTQEPAEYRQSAVYLFRRIPVVDMFTGSTLLVEAHQTETLQTMGLSPALESAVEIPAKIDPVIASTSVRDFEAGVHALHEHVVEYPFQGS